MKIDQIRANIFNVDIEDKLQNNKSVSFEDVLKEFINNVNTDQKQAAYAEKLFMEGKTDNVEEIMYYIQKASISLSFLVEVRNRLENAYHEIMRMQV